MAKRIRYVQQWTLETKSDHRALFVHVQIRRPGGRWCDLIVATANMGGHFDHVDLGRVLASAHGFIPMVVMLQEGSDRPFVEHVATQWGFTYVGGDGKVGQRATPLLVSPGIRVERIRWQELLGRVNVGPGAGPNRNKPKWWTRTRLVLEAGDVPFGASSWHLLASQQNRLRLVNAMRQARPVVHALRNIRRPFVVAGDLNSSTGQPLAKWLLRRGVTTNHEQLGAVPTHGRRSIDAVACARSVCAQPRPILERNPA